MYVLWRKITTFKRNFARTILYLQVSNHPPPPSFAQQVCAQPRYLSKGKPINSPAPDTGTLNKKITHLIRTSRLEDAKTLFDEINYKNTVTWNSMLSGYVQCREMAKARKLFDEMPKRDVVSWNLIIAGYISCRGNRYIEVARYLFDQMPKRDFISWNTMISGYTKKGRMDEAMSLFNSMPARNVVSWKVEINLQIYKTQAFIKTTEMEDKASTKVQSREESHSPITKVCVMVANGTEGIGVRDSA